MNGAAIRDTVLGINSTILTFNPLIFGDEGNYFCNVTSRGVTVQSNFVTITGKSHILNTLSACTYWELDGKLVLPHMASN